MLCDSGSNDKGILKRVVDPGMHEIDEEEDSCANALQIKTGYAERARRLRE